MEKQNVMITLASIAAHASPHALFKPFPSNTVQYPIFNRWEGSIMLLLPSFFAYKPFRKR
jgi:hypothetical protein